MSSFFRAHKPVISRVIAFSLVAFGAFWLTPSWSEAGPFYFLFFFAILVMLIASQLFWIRRVLDLGERFIPGKPRRAASRVPSPYFDPYRGVIGTVELRAVNSKSPHMLPLNLGTTL